MRGPFLLLLPLALFACDGAGVPTQKDEKIPEGPISRPDRRFAEKIHGIQGLGNVGKMHDGLYRGEQPTEEGYAYLKKLGVRTIINFRRLHSSKEEVEKLGMTYVSMPLVAGIDGSEPPEDAQIREFFDIVLDPAKQPVYFHCAHGKDRTGTMAALYRIEVDGWTPTEAIEEMHDFGYHKIYKDLVAFVRDYTPRGFKAPGK